VPHVEKWELGKIGRFMEKVQMGFSNKISRVYES
jgi:hypothetical protein